MSNTFFRVDHWQRNGNGSRFSFVETIEAAQSEVKNMVRIPNSRDGYEHTEITSFVADTCDMDGWEKGQWGQTEIYVSKSDAETINQMQNAGY